MTEFDFGEGFRPAMERMKESDEQRLRHSAKSVSFGVSFLDDIAYGILPTDLIVLGAETGAGKTTLGMLFAQACAKRELSVHYFALEAHKNEIEQRIKFREMARLAWDRRLEGRHGFTYAAWVHGECETLGKLVASDAENICAGQIETLQTFYRNRKFTKDDIVRLFHAIRNESDLIVFDHLHYVDSDDENENRAMRSVVKTISETVLEIEVPVIAIAHLRKRDNRRPTLIPDIHEFHGASDITKGATKVIVIAKARDRIATDRYIANTYMSCEKDRVVGNQDLVALIGFDVRSSTYEDRYELGRLNSARNKFEPLTPFEKPFWAERGVCKGTSSPQGASE